MRNTHKKKRLKNKPNDISHTHKHICHCKNVSLSCLNAIWGMFYTTLKRVFFFVRFPHNGEKIHTKKKTLRNSFACGSGSLGAVIKFNYLRGRQMCLVVGFFFVCYFCNPWQLPVLDNIIECEGFLGWLVSLNIRKSLKRLKSYAFFLVVSQRLRKIINMQSIVEFLRIITLGKYVLPKQYISLGIKTLYRLTFDLPTLALLGQLPFCYTIPSVILSLPRRLPPPTICHSNPCPPIVSIDISPSFTSRVSTLALLTIFLSTLDLPVSVSVSVSVKFFFLIYTISTFYGVLGP